MNIRIHFAALSAFTLAAAMGCGAPAAEDDLGTSQEPLFAGPAFSDFGTQCTVGGKTMHCCPKVGTAHSVMVGAHVGQNVFTCRTLSDSGFIDTSFLDTGTQRNGMHACPTGSFMRGLHDGQNLLTCIFPPHQIVLAREFVDTGTQANGMHVCGTNNTPFQYAMAGIHVGQNRFTCDTDTLPN